MCGRGYSRARFRMEISQTTHLPYAVPGDHKCSPRQSPAYSCHCMCSLVAKSGENGKNTQIDKHGDDFDVITRYAAVARWKAQGGQGWSRANHTQRENVSRKLMTEVDMKGGFRPGPAHDPARDR